jgi:hypothetical protein
MRVILQTWCQIQRTSYQFTLCELWSLTYTKHLQLSIFTHQYSAVGNCAAIRDISTILCALYCKFGAKYSAHPPVYAMWTVVQAIYKVFTAPHIYCSIFSCRYLRCYCRYHDNSMRVILYSGCQMQRTTSCLRYLNCGREHVRCTYSSTYSVFNIQLNVSSPLLEIYQQLNVRYTANSVPIQRTTSGLNYVNRGPEIYNAITVPHNQASIFNWTYLCCNLRYLDNLTRVVLQAWCQIQRISSSLHYVNCGPGHIQYNYMSA